MLVRFTPKQIQKLKDFLKTVRLNAYDIPLYNEILIALDNAIDEKVNKNKPREINVRTNFHEEKKQIPEVSEPIKESAKINFSKIVEDSIINTDSNEEPVSSLEDINLVDDIVSEPISDINDQEPDTSYMEESIDSEVKSNVECIPPFGIIDRRTKRGNKNDYI